MEKCTNKEKLAIFTACLAFILGWVLTFWGFLAPPYGEIADSVLWVLGQGLIYAASVFGVTSYFTAESTKMKSELKNYFNSRLSGGDDE